MKPAIEKRSRKTKQGFSTIELVIALGVIAVVAAMAIPTWQRMQKNARLNGDAHSMAEALSIAKMRAAADFTESRMFFFYGTDKLQYFRVDVWNKSANSGNGCWVPDAVTNPGTGATYCITTTAYQGSETYLSTGVSGGYASLATAQDLTTIAQASPCRQGGSTVSNGTAMTNTACVQFNSRGFPTAKGAYYITDSTRVYEVSVNAMGLVHSYVSPASTASWAPY